MSSAQADQMLQALDALGKMLTRCFSALECIEFLLLAVLVYLIALGGKDR